MAQEDSKSGSSEEQSPKYWRAILGDICQLPSFPRATGDPNRYVECVRQAADVTDRKDLGIWLLRECLPGYEFVASARRCKTVRSNCQTTTTQQQYCPQQQEVVQQPQSCPLVQGGVQNAAYQGICSWMVDPLAKDPESCTHFLQCQPAPNNLYCGRWQRMPCAPATIFDEQAQVCVWDTSSQPASLPTPAPYVPTQAQQNSQCGCTGGVQIGSCNQNYQCPGQSVCQVGQQNGNQCMVCCYFRKKAKRA
ncbi:unnamed protein product, partial [Mesorhabditis spiculigera]